jgi:hypothetical protein
MADNDKDIRVDASKDNAVLLLAAAEELELEAGVVRTTSDNVFIVPESVAKKAGLKESEQGQDFAEAVAEAREAADAARAEEQADAEDKPARKATAKKATAKKAAASKTAASKE